MVGVAAEIAHLGITGFSDWHSQNPPSNLAAQFVAVAMPIVPLEVLINKRHSLPAETPISEAIQLGFRVCPFSHSNVDAPNFDESTKYDTFSIMST